MYKFTATTIAALMAAVAVMPATSSPADARHRGRNVAIGVLTGAAALAIIANGNRAHASDYDDGDYNQCRRWRHRCDDGSDWACRKYDRNC